MTSTQLLYDAAGRPDVAHAEAITGTCWLCGSPVSRGIALCCVIKDTFVDYDKARAPHASHFCLPCAWSFSEAIPMTGRDKPQRLRNYSHIVQNGVWHCMSKGDKAKMKPLLLNPPDGDWLGVIAESGQKHIIFRAPIATGRTVCAIQFEEQRLTYRPDDLAGLLADIEALLTLGFSKTEVERGEYIPHRILKAGFEIWRAHEETIKTRRGSSLLTLALFLAQKEETSERPATGGDDPGPDPASVDGLGHMGKKEAQILGHPARSDSGGGVHQQHGRLAQLGLFADERDNAGAQ